MHCSKVAQQKFCYQVDKSTIFGIQVLHDVLIDIRRGALENYRWKNKMACTDGKNKIAAMVVSSSLQLYYTLYFSKI